MGEKITFRPHHFMCTLGFRGYGYSLGFVKNYKKIVQQLYQQEDTIIEVVGNMDSVCSACPNRLSETLCKTQEKIDKLDARHREILQLQDGEQLSWREAKARIKKHMTAQKFDQACDGCSWKDYGVCKKALEDLI